MKFYLKNDLHIVDTLDIPTSDHVYLENLLEERLWGPSVLFIDDTQVMSFNITSACHNLKGLTLMPTTGLNVYSMLKHNTVVMSLKSLETIEERLLTKIHSTDFKAANIKRN